LFTSEEILATITCHWRTCLAHFLVQRMPWLLCPLPLATSFRGVPLSGGAPPNFYQHHPDPCARMTDLSRRILVQPIAVLWILTKQYCRSKILPIAISAEKSFESASIFLAGSGTAKRHADHQHWPRGIKPVERTMKHRF
jgi:hypothetical protein